MCKIAGIPLSLCVTLKRSHGSEVKLEVLCGMNAMAAGARHFMQTCLLKLHFVLRGFRDTETNDGRHSLSLLTD